MRYRHIAMFLGSVLIVAACGGGSSGDETQSTDSIAVTETEPPATDPPATDPPATDPPVTEPPVTEPPATEVPVTDPPVTDPPATDPPVTDPPAAELPEPSELFAQEFFDSSEFDDVPICQSFGRFFNRYINASFSGLVAGTDEAISQGDDELIVEKLELIFYLGIGDDAAALQRALPAEILRAFGPVLDRVVAARRIMVEAGFSDAELAAIDDEVNGVGTDSVADDDPRLTAAAEALVAEFGTANDAIDQSNSTTAEDEAIGDAWLDGACPKLSAAFNA